MAAAAFRFAPAQRRHGGRLNSCSPGRADRLTLALSLATPVQSSSIIDRMTRRNYLLLRRGKKALRSRLLVVCCRDNKQDMKISEYHYNMNYLF